MKLSKTQTAILFGIPLLAGAYLIYRQIAKPKLPKNLPPPLQPLPPSTVPAVNTGFPLAKGSKGAKVVELQNTLLMYSSNILPKYGADGSFGSETEAALAYATGGKKSIASQAELDLFKKQVQDFVQFNASFSNPSAATPVQNTSSVWNGLFGL